MENEGMKKNNKYIYTVIYREKIIIYIKFRKFTNKFINYYIKIRKKKTFKLFDIVR
jgi:hypothetical protein